MTTRRADRMGERFYRSRARLHLDMSEAIWKSNSQLDQSDIEPLVRGVHIIMSRDHLTDQDVATIVYREVRIMAINPHDDEQVAGFVSWAVLVVGEDIRETRERWRRRPI